jgi:hypothetical protein
MRPPVAAAIVKTKMGMGTDQAAGSSFVGQTLNLSRDTSSAVFRFWIQIILTSCTESDFFQIKVDNKKHI